ncbi:hypothetical protein JHW45_04870 [Paracoccus stylophorae]|uniref:Uncharacterized protein n=1 Tax=Paracoccus stylophorae TaxID=659350 RepID=A0ABY7SY25_9RHOB|nr:hypothetical protein [Paracoccus stylophorae]WCR11710.1 hypothetical protein JHW45_04870 [Paracoccus stylophorae]
MSYNENDPGRSASKHRPALIGIAVAIIAAIVAYLVFLPGTDEQNEGIATTAPPADTAVSEASGTDAGSTPDIAPEGSAPVTPDGEATAPEAETN